LRESKENEYVEMTRPWTILLGPPGTGKTTTLLDTLRGHLDAGVPPDRIGFLTFTRRAAEEAAGRVAVDFRLEKDALPYFRTIHSLCMRQIGASAGSILEGRKMAEFGDWIGERITGHFRMDEGTWSGYEPGDRMLFMDNLARVRRIPLRQLYNEDSDGLDWSRVERFSRGMREYKDAHRMLDFTDLLEQFVKQKRYPKLEALLVDEAQDLSLIQWDVIRAMAVDDIPVTIAGDDDQSIYQWAGADTDTMIDMLGSVVVLGQSYRVPRRVQSVANRIIGQVSHRRPKVWNAREGEGIARRAPSLAAIDFSKNGDRGEDGTTMVLTRNRRPYLDNVANQLRAAGRLYSRDGSPSVKRSTLDAIVCWERLRNGVSQRVSDIISGPYDLIVSGRGLDRGFKKLPRFHPDEMVSMDDLRRDGGLRTDREWFDSLNRIPEQDVTYIRACRANGERLTREPRIRLSTIHGSKGGEADRVVLVRDRAFRTHREAATNPDAEHRVFYVGVTRAKEELIVVSPQTALHYKI
jgi:DNA helicase-2/ATP-dependent DNA helicase PcrA